MATAKRPTLRKNDRVTLASHKSVIPSYDGKPFVLRDTVLTVSHLTGTGSNRNPWHVVVTDGTHFWYLEPDDVTPVDNVDNSAAHSAVKQRNAERELDDWLNRHGYRHERQPPVAGVGHAAKSYEDPAERLSIATFPTGISYADKQRQRHGDYLRLAFLPFKTLELEWAPVPIALGLRHLIEEHAQRLRARRGEDYPTSTNGQTVKLGHARVIHHATRKRGDAPKFQVGDIVRRTAARMRSMGIIAGPVNGKVVGYSGPWPLIHWSDMSESDEPMTQAEEGLELDKRAMARRPAVGHARMIHQAPTGRAVFAAHERDHHITTSGRRALTSAQFALPPGPEEKRRGIKGRLPIDTLDRARNALTRAAQMLKHGSINLGQLTTARRRVHAAWPSIESYA